MAQDIINENQILSYTNQDFSSIYTEVLSLIKQLTYKWDPSISDESDPGVILVKLSALIADKCNYNIDKSILEAFPLSVTQDSNARQLYEQLGYYMDWYESARTNVSITYTEKPASDTTQTFTIPRFTIICDNESMHNYALIGTEDDKGFVVSDTYLSDDGKPVLVTAIEGTPVRYTYQGESVITSHMIDPITRRLYFSSAYVSQNGIFINNVGQDNYASWKRVNNLYEQTYNELRYVFGYDGSSNLCYMEFPDNYAELIGSGVEITYMIIDESYENLPSQQLTQFLSPVTIKVDEKNTMILDVNNTKIANYTASYGHKNKETINEAYTNYKRTVGTFKTLITLRDYLNFIRNRESEICSNAFVCDRTNDVQSTYKIMSRRNDLDTLLVKVEHIVDKTADESVFNYTFKKTYDEEPLLDKTYYRITDNDTLEEIVDVTGKNPREEGWYELIGVAASDHEALSPFSLKFYLLKNAVSLNSKSAYDETFNMMYQPPDIDTLLEDTAHLEHTYEDILPLGIDTYKKTTDTSFSHTKSYYYYEKDTKHYRLITDLASYETYYTPVDLEEYSVGDIVDPSTKDWFEEVDGITLKTTDTFARLGDFEDSKAFFVQADVKASSHPAEYGWFEYDITTGEYFLTPDTRPEIEKMYYVLKNYLESHLGIPGEQYDLYELDVEALLPHIVFFKNIYPIQLDISTYEPVTEDVQVIIMNNVITALFENTNSSEVDFGENVALDYLINVVENSDDRIRTARFNTLNYTTKAIYYDAKASIFKEVELDSDMTNLYPESYQSEDSILKARFKKDILAKSILAGTTQLIIPDSTFTYHLSHKFISFLEGIASITSEAIISFQDEDATTSYSMDDDDNIFIRKTYKLKENEIVTLYRPSLTDAQQFMSGARFEYLIYRDVDANQSYKLSAGEYFIFYTQVANDSNAIIGYNSYAFTDGAIIKPTFDLAAQNNLNNLSKYARNRIVAHFATNKGVSEYDAFTNNNTYMTEIRNSITITQNTLTNSDTISIQKLNTIEIKGEDKYKFFWVLSNPTYSNDDNLKTFTLFDDFDSHEDHPVDLNTYTLKSGEYLYYTDADEKDLHILGPGTIITRNCGVIPETVTYSEVYSSIYFENCDVLNMDALKTCKYITNAAGNISPVMNGMYVTVHDPVPYEPDGGSPVKLSLYEYNGAFYVLTEDEEFSMSKLYYDKSIFVRSADTDIVPDVVYYLMLTRKNSDWLRRTTQGVDIDGNPIYSYISDISGSAVFEEIQPAEDNSLINPKELGYYEKVSYNNQVIEDVYPYNDSGIPTNHARFAATLDETVLSRNILRSMPIYESWDITSPNSYRTMSEDELVDIPSTNVLNLKIPTYKSYYKKVGDTFELVANVDYLSKPKESSWYEKNSLDNYILTSDVEPAIISVKDSNVSSILEYVEAEYGMDFYRKCYFFSPNLYAQAYYYDVEKKKAEFLASDIIYGSNGNLGSPLNRLQYLYEQIASEYQGGTEWLDEICDQRWSSLYTYNPPNTWVVPGMTDSPVGRWTTPPSAGEVEGKYIKIESILLEGKSDLMDAIYPAFTLDSNPEDTTFEKADFFVPAKHFATLEIEPSAENPLPYYELSGNNITLDSDLKLARMFPRATGIELGKFQVYYLPLLYKVGDYVSYSTSKYYTPKAYFTKTFRDPISSWTCSAVDNNKIAEDPINYIHSLWRNMQYNTSITITESEIWSFAEGDDVIVEAEEVTDTILDWPVLSGDECVIDTDRFKLAFQRKGQDFEELDNLSIEGYSWRGYSSLLLNTASNNGQRLYPNQYLTLYGEDSTDPMLEFSGEPNVDIIFQLKYPVANKSGKFIEVKVEDALGETQLNSIYIFRTLLNGEFYQYTTDVYDTYLYFNSYLPDPESGDPMVRSPREIKIPVGLPWGNYLLPINTKTDVKLEAHFSQSVLFDKDEIDINLKPSASEITESHIKIAGYSQDLKLHSFVDKDRTEFIGDKLQFIEVDLDKYCKINLPAYITEQLELSPVDMGLYEMNSYGEYFVSENEGIGTDLIYKIASIDITSDQNPYALGWYELDGEDYILSEDETPDLEKNYYRDLDFYIPINEVNSYINFTIKAEDDSEYEKQATLIIKDVFRFSKNADLGDETYDALFAHMRRLDKDEEYNFTFVPSQNDLIKNPLEPNSFWSHNHVYNPYTIAQLNFDEIDYKFINTK